MPRQSLRADGRQEWVPKGVPARVAWRVVKREPAGRRRRWAEAAAG